jgi:hypothetical protein
LQGFGRRHLAAILAEPLPPKARRTVREAAGMATAKIGPPLE